MDYSVKLPDGSEVVLLYTKNFTWKDEEKGKEVDSAPHTGRVYRALKTVGDNNYYVNLEIPHTPGKIKVEGIRITSLKYNTPEWSCDFEEVTEDNIVDFDIVAEDYQKIGSWLETEQKDFINRLFHNGMDVEVSEHDDIKEIQEGSVKITDLNSIAEVIKHSLSGMNDGSRAIEAIQWISLRDPMGLDAITKLLMMYAQFLKDEENSPYMPLQREVATSELHGRGANIGYIAKALDAHSRSKTARTDLIFSMFVPLVFDLIRQEINPNS